MVVQVVGQVVVQVVMHVVAQVIVQVLVQLILPSPRADVVTQRLSSYHSTCRHPHNGGYDDVCQPPTVEYNNTNCLLTNVIQTTKTTKIEEFFTSKQ